MYVTSPPVDVIPPRWRGLPSPIPFLCPAGVGAADVRLSGSTRTFFRSGQTILESLSALTTPSWRPCRAGPCALLEVAGQTYGGR